MTLDIISNEYHSKFCDADHVQFRQRVRNLKNKMERNMWEKKKEKGKNHMKNKENQRMWHKKQRAKKIERRRNNEICEKELVEEEKVGSYMKKWKVT